MGRKQCCGGSFICVNQDCIFSGYSQKENCLHFNISDKACSTCEKSGLYVPCDALKIWGFNNNKNMVTVFHDGSHTCVAMQLFEVSEEVEKKINSGGTTITKSTEDPIIDCLKEENPLWNDLYKIANSTLEQEKLYNAKQKANAENFPHGHSLEAIASLRSKLLGKNPFFIFRLDNWLMNGTPTFFFKMSYKLAHLSLSVNCVGSDFLNGEYCFADGKFQIYPGFVTLYVYVCEDIKKNYEA